MSQRECARERWKERGSKTGVNGVPKVRISCAACVYMNNCGYYVAELGLACLSAQHTRGFVLTAVLQKPRSCERFERRIFMSVRAGVTETEKDQLAD